MPPIITSRANARVKQLRAAFQANDRLSRGLIPIEGEHLLEEAIRSHQTIRTVFLAERRDPPPNLPANVEVLNLTSELFTGLTLTRAPQGIAALIEPPAASIQQMLHPPALIVVAAGLQDPGNLGTLIRSAEAFGATGVLTTPGTVSPWNGKSLRASAGSVFRLPLTEISAETATFFAEHHIALLAAVRSGATPIHSVDLTRPTALLIGNEGAGVPADWIAHATQRVTIPTPGPVESLNAAIAAGILLYEAARQRANGQQTTNNGQRSS